MMNVMQTLTPHTGPIGRFGTQKSLDTIHTGPQRYYHKVSTVASTAKQTTTTD